MSFLIKLQDSYLKQKHKQGKLLPHITIDINKGRCNISETKVIHNSSKCQHINISSIKKFTQALSVSEHSVW
jgi:hypothetical protein